MDNNKPFDNLGFTDENDTINSDSLQSGDSYNENSYFKEEENKTSQINDNDNEIYSQSSSVNYYSDITSPDDEYKSTAFTSQDNKGQYQYSGQQSESPTTNYSAYGYGYNQNGQSSQYNAQQNTYQSYHYQQPAPPQNKAKTNKKKGGGKFAVTIILCVLLSGVVGFAGGVLSDKFTELSNKSGTESNMTINHVNTEIKTTQSTETELSTAEIADLVADSVVEITTEIVQTGAFSSQYISSGAGSGVIVSENGYIVTNNHVIDGASRINVTLRNGESYEAKLVGTDGILDVALLKIEKTGLTPAVFGDSDTLEVGDKAVVIGNPLGQLGGTVTDGIISALNRDVVIDDQTMNLMQTNAAINPGNSGGGLFNGQGELVGIVVAKSSGEEIEGLGFAIPINDVEEVLDDLIDYGYVRGRVSLGMSLLDISNYATAMMYNVDEVGCYVYSVDANTNAQKAGFTSGDRITKVGSTSVSSVAEVEKALESYKVGDSVEFTIVRNNQTQKITLVLEEYTPAQTQQNENTQQFSTPNDSLEDFFNSFW